MSATRNNKEEGWYTEEPPITSWEALHKLYTASFSSQNGSIYWVFRAAKQEDGEDKATQGLRTRLEKAFELYGVHSYKKEWERDIIREFQRKASLYVGHVPDGDDILEWLALMRHYGAPTRLLDWTYSFFIAVYFSLAENKEGVVWAFDSNLVSNAQKAKKRITKTGEDEKGLFLSIEKRLAGKRDLLELQNENYKLVDLAIASYLFKRPTPFIHAVNPFRLNQRLSIQQGIFLLSGSVEMSFEENLRRYLPNTKQLKNGLHRIAIKADTEERKKILRELHQMNIGNAVLFPGLDGFAKSLAEKLAMPEPAGISIRP
jgi:hypothetical protein